MRTGAGIFPQELSRKICLFDKDNILPTAWAVNSFSGICSVIVKLLKINLGLFDLHRPFLVWEYARLAQTVLTENR